MNHKLKKTVATVVLTASLMSGSYSALAADPAAVAAANPAVTSYTLTSALDFEVKAVLNETVAEGTRLGVVIRMKNNGTGPVRVPDYELRVKTNEGIEYTLQPSATNVKSIQPKANTELGYMAVIDRTDEVVLSELNWTDVDVYVYPKKETVIATAPITGVVWAGSDTVITDPKAVKKWADSFVIPSLTSPIQYTPTSITKESTANGTVFVVQLLAYNPASKREAVPAFSIDGRSEDKVFSGSRVEQGTVSLEAKEEKYIHFAIKTDLDTTLKSLTVLTPEKFTASAAGGAGASAGAAAASAGASGAGAAGTGAEASDASAGAAAGAAGAAGSAGAAAASGYSVGRLSVLLPTEQGSQLLDSYKLGTPMVFDDRSELIHPGMEVSIKEFSMFDNTEEGSKTVIAKYSLLNKTDRPLAVPAFGTDLVSSDGYQYSGVRQKISTPSVLPNSALTVSYAFTVPSSETGAGLALKIQDAVTAAPYKTTIASYRAELQTDMDDNKFSVYPFNVTLKDWTLGSLFNQATGDYSYKGKFFFDIERVDQVQLDPSFSGLLFELYDSAGRVIGSGKGSFTGTNRLTTGENNLIFPGTTQQFDHPLTIKIYEVFTTADGSEARRQVGELKQ